MAPDPFGLPMAAQISAIGLQATYISTTMSFCCSVSTWYFCWLRMLNPRPTSRDLSAGTDMFPWAAASRSEEPEE